ncbi:MAG: hypothetical protein Q4C47_09145, partial [Planctomycetia bacterium]|nr:hypothetical protein [Planctomycetia bacterium]
REMESGAEPIRFELPRPLCDVHGSFILNVGARSELLLIPEPEKLRGLVRIGQVSQFRPTSITDATPPTLPFGPWTSGTSGTTYPETTDSSRDRNGIAGRQNGSGEITGPENLVRPGETGGSGNQVGSLPETSGETITEGTGGSLPPGTAGMDPGSTGGRDALRYRASPETALFVGTFRTLEQKIDLFSTTELRMRTSRWEVLQKFRYRVRNRSAEQLFLDFPPEMADLPLDATFNGRPVVVDTVTGIATIAGTTVDPTATTVMTGDNDGKNPENETSSPRIRKRIQLPEPLLGEGELSLRYTLNQTFLPDAFGEQITIPLILPEGGELRRQLCLIRTPETIRTSAADPDWEPGEIALFRTPVDFNTSWMSLADGDAIPVGIPSVDPTDATGTGTKTDGNAGMNGTDAGMRDTSGGDGGNAGTRVIGEAPAGETDENQLCLVTDSRRRELAIELRRDDNRDVGTTFVERGWVRSWFAGRVREDRAVFLIRNNTRRTLTLELPPGVLPANVRVWLDGRLIHGIPDTRTSLFDLFPERSGTGNGVGSRETSVSGRRDDLSGAGTGNGTAHGPVGGPGSGGGSGAGMGMATGNGTGGPGRENGRGPG